MCNTPSLNTSAQYCFLIFMTLHSIMSVLNLLHTSWGNILIGLSSVVHELLKPKCSGHKRDEVSENRTMIFKTLAYDFHCFTVHFCITVVSLAPTYALL
jgi:hypothetical protein